MNFMNITLMNRYAAINLVTNIKGEGLSLAGLFCKSSRYFCSVADKISWRPITLPLWPCGLLLPVCLCLNLVSTTIWSHHLWNCISRSLAELQLCCSKCAKNCLWWAMKFSEVDHLRSSIHHVRACIRLVSCRQ